MKYSEVIEMRTVLTDKAQRGYPITVKFIDRNTGLSFQRRVNEQDCDKLQRALGQFNSGILTAFEMLTVCHSIGRKAK